MRIKKKDLLEAFKPEKVADDLAKAKEFIEGPTKDFIDSTTKALGNDDKAKKIAKNFAGMIVGPDEVKEEGADEVHTKKFDSCVKKVKANSDVDNAYAVCQDSLGKDAINPSHRRTVKEVIKVKNLKK